MNADELELVDEAKRMELRYRGNNYVDPVAVMQVRLLAAILQKMDRIEADQERLASQFDAVSAGGTSMLMVQS